MRNILGEELPDVLYRYRSWEVNEKTGKNYTKELLENNQFHLSQVDQLNDPFECTVIPSVEATPEEVNRRFEKFLNVPQQSGIDPEELKLQMDMFRTNIGYRKIFMQQKNQKDRIDTGICSLAGPNHTESLMWSHYADKHKGICLVFDTVKLMQSDVANRLNILKVDYEETWSVVK